MDEQLIGRAHRSIDGLHSTIYFAPDAEAMFTGAGLRPGRMTYFAQRSAPMGRVGAGPVAATFFNFNPEIVARHIPRAWTLLDPVEMVRLRFAAAESVLRRLLGVDVIASAEMAELAGLLERATAACDIVGRPLYAAHAELDWPDGPAHLRMWHAATLLREHRGDGHVAAVVSHRLSGIEALVSHSATGHGMTPGAAQSSRGWSPEQWEAAEARLAQRGILDGAGELSAAGNQLRASLEAATDEMAAAPWQSIGTADTERVIELGKGFARIAVGAGAFPRGVFGR